MTNHMRDSHPPLRRPKRNFWARRRVPWVWPEDWLTAAVLLVGLGIVVARWA